MDTSIVMQFWNSYVLVWKFKCAKSEIFSSPMITECFVLQPLKNKYSKWLELRIRECNSSLVVVALSNYVFPSVPITWLKNSMVHFTECLDVRVSLLEGDSSTVWTLDHSLDCIGGDSANIHHVENQNFIACICLIFHLHCFIL